MENTGKKKTPCINPGQLLSPKGYQRQSSSSSASKSSTSTSHGYNKDSSYEQSDESPDDHGQKVTRKTLNRGAKSKSVPKSKKPDQVNTSDKQDF